METLLLGAAVFAATDVDDLVLLSALFADPRFRARSVVAGQFLGILALTGASALAAALALAAPAEWVALLGLVPLALGVRVLFAGDADGDDGETPPEIGPRGQALAVAGVTIANGGDNLAIHIPLFAANPDAVPALALLFLAMTGLLSAAAFALVRNPVMGARIARWGERALPWVLIALGLAILWGARGLFWA